MFNFSQKRFHLDAKCDVGNIYMGDMKVSYRSTKHQTLYKKEWTINHTLAYTQKRHF